eukprot:TRINITY_DN6168_c0_g1_i4.p1 TRINITY_DN6168_c0_g1~~TRINITY_DN6168_c0_g1_i4.p1  ORF type:complete len:439 (-),score=84.20 TRINITY_DN6168_c0_g1_i4:144-1460(-)
MRINHSLLILAILVASFVNCQESEGSKNDDIFLGEDHHPGFVPLNDKGEDYFYWLFRSRRNPQADPLVFWLTGGPGCSSVFAAFFEGGPFRINDDLTLRINPYSWSNLSNLVFVDQPRGTGYSRTKGLDYDFTEGQIANDFYTFLVGFLQQHPEYEGRPMYITGESYAGHYIPAISKKIVEEKNPKIALVAAGIGNGWVSAKNQYPEYANFAYENQLINTATLIGFRQMYKGCQDLIKAKLWPIASYYCEVPTNFIIGTPDKFNVYDIRIPCEVPPLCYNTSSIDVFLQRADVQTALNVTGRKWLDCNTMPYVALSNDNLYDLSNSVTYLLENNVSVLVYNGDRDFICNWRGGEAWTNKLKWAHSEEFKNANYTDWIANGKYFGQYKKVDKLTFLRVFQAGHMVPMDQPEAALAMFDLFIRRLLVPSEYKDNSEVISS